MEAAHMKTARAGLFEVRAKKTKFWTITGYIAVLYFHPPSALAYRKLSKPIKPVKIMESFKMWKNPDDAIQFGLELIHRYWKHSSQQAAEALIRPFSLVREQVPTQQKEIMFTMPGTPITSGDVYQVDLYEVSVNTDLTEGRGSNETVAWCLTKGEAIAAAKGRDVMGSCGAIKLSTVRLLNCQTTGGQKIFLLDKEIELGFEDKTEIKRKALAKLTAKEREVLGVDDDD